MKPAAPDRSIASRSGPTVDAQFAISPAATAVAWLVLLAGAAAIVFALLCIVGKISDRGPRMPEGISTGTTIAVAGAVCSAAYWFLKEYPKWVRDTHRPGGLPTRNTFERGLPPALLALGKVAPLFALPTGMLGVGILLRRWREMQAESNAAMPYVTGGAILLTSVFVLYAAPHVWGRDEGRTAISTSAKGSRASEGSWMAIVRFFAPWFAVCSAIVGLVIVSGRIRDLLAVARPWEVTFCGISLLATAGCAMLLAKRVQARDKSGSDPASNPRKAEHAEPRHA